MAISRFAELARWSESVDQRLEHLTFAVGDLSQGQRALAFDMKEVKRDLQVVQRDVHETKTAVARIEQVQTLHGQLLQTQGDLLRTILARLDERR